MVLPRHAYRVLDQCSGVSGCVSVSVHEHMVDLQCGVLAVTMQCQSTLVQLDSVELRRSPLASMGITQLKK